MADRPVGTAAGLSSGPLGIIAGSGGLPRRLIDDCRGKGREVFVLALEGEADAEIVAGADHAWCRLGAAAKALKLLRAHGVTDVVLAAASIIDRASPLSGPIGAPRSSSPRSAIACSAMTG